MGLTTKTRPKVDEPIVIPDFGGDQYKAWEWLKDQARSQGKDELIHQVKEKGNCSAQTVTKTMELARLLDIPMNIGQFA